MEGKTVLVTVVLATLGIAVAVAGFAAEATKPKRSQLTVKYDGLEPECHHPSNPAMGLAIAAAVALVLARTIIISATGGGRRCSYCQPLPIMPVIGRVCIIISWITYFLALVLFFVGAKLSIQSSVKADINGVLYCYYLSPGLFSTASIMGLVSVLLGIVYYFLYVLSQRRAAEKPCVDLELWKLTIADAKKPPTISDGMKPHVSLQKH